MIRRWWWRLRARWTAWRDRKKVEPAWEQARGQSLWAAIASDLKEHGG